jgi:hypothetical protein
MEKNGDGGVAVIGQYEQEKSTSERSLISISPQVQKILFWLN